MKKIYLLSIKSLLCMTLLLSCLVISAEWDPKLKSGNTKSIEIDYISYITKNTAYSISSKGIIYRTKDNFKTYEKIKSNIPITEEVKFFEMTSETVGTLVTKRYKYFGVDSSFIYTTENGGYSWLRVMELPIPILALNTYSESMFFKRKNQKLYILYGDITCHGEMNGKKWEYARFKYNRTSQNRDFEVFNDSIWSFRYGLDRFWTSDYGNTWGMGLKKFSAPFSFNMFAALGNTIQAINVHLQEHKIFEYSFEEDKWVELIAIYGMNPQDLLQLSDSILLIDFWDWVNNKRKNGVYNRKQNKWIELDTISSFFKKNIHSDIDYWTNRGSSIVAFSYYKRQFHESTDYGQTWSVIIPDYQYMFSHVTQLSFNDNMGIALSYSSLLYSFDKGESWKTIQRDSLCMDILGYSPCKFDLSYQNDAQLYLTGNITGKILQNGDKISIEKSPFKFGDSIPYTFDISDLGENETYLTGKVGDSVYLFKSNSQNQLTALASAKSSGNTNLLQNHKWVVFALGKNIYSYQKQSKEINLVAENINNQINNMEFLGDDSIYIGVNFVTVVFDLENNTGEKIVHSLSIEGLGQFNTIYAQASNGKSEIIVCDHYNIYSVDLPDFQDHRIDSDFYYRDVIRIFRYWNGSFWAGGERNIYKKQEVSREAKDFCFEIEWSGPNPVDKNLTLMIKVKETDNINFQLYSSVGELIHKSSTVYFKGLYDKAFDFEQLASGVFYLKVSSPCGNNQVIKLIKE